MEGTGVQTEAAGGRVGTRMGQAPLTERNGVYAQKQTGNRDPLRGQVQAQIGQVHPQRKKVSIYPGNSNTESKKWSEATTHKHTHTEEISTDPQEKAEEMIQRERTQVYTSRKCKQADSMETTAHREDGC